MEDIFQSFGLQQTNFTIERLSSGYINHTYKLTGQRSYILQRINKDIFKQPEIIAGNIRTAANYLKQNHPTYLFLAPEPAGNGNEMSYDTEGYPWRLFRYIENSMTINKVETPQEAFSASAEFARLTSNLEGVEIGLFKPSIEGFHDLSWRHQQFQEAVRNADPQRLHDARGEVELCTTYSHLVTMHHDLIQTDSLQLRITHNDTKINNILIDATSREAICVIDLDTLMPGYFLYDVGDMIRTFVSPVDEEEKDLSAIRFRQNIYDALVAGYLSQMGDKLTAAEQKLFPFAGMMMTYIMALRILADFLNGDVYYQTTYPMQKNQLQLLSVLETAVGLGNF
jgi:Ser/Thr protein kinase RdoA (MazF antagonist)